MLSGGAAAEGALLSGVSGVSLRGRFFFFLLPERTRLAMLPFSRAVSRFAAPLRCL